MLSLWTLLESSLSWPCDIWTNGGGCSGRTDKTGIVLSFATFVVVHDVSVLVFLRPLPLCMVLGFYSLIPSGSVFYWEKMHS